MKRMLLAGLVVLCGTALADTDSTAHGATVVREEVSFPDQRIRAGIFAGAFVLLGTGIVLLNRVRRERDKEAGF